MDERSEAVRNNIIMQPEKIKEVYDYVEDFRTISITDTDLVRFSALFESPPFRTFKLTLAQFMETHGELPTASGFNCLLMLLSKYGICGTFGELPNSRENRQDKE